MPNVVVNKTAEVNLAKPVVQQTLTLGVTAAAGPALRRLVFVAPYACTVTAATLTAYATIAANGSDYWSFLVEKLDGTDVGTTLTTAAAALTAGTPRSFTVVAAAATLAAGDPLYLYMADTGSPSDLDAAYLLVSIHYQPA